MYTLLVLHDPNTGTLVDDSLEIAVYLEKAYPAKPIFPYGSEILIRVFDSTYLDDAHPAARLMYMRTAERLNLVSAEFFRRTRSERFQLPWEELSSEGPKRNGDWAYLEQCFNKEEVRTKWVEGELWEIRSRMRTLSWLASYFSSSTS